MHAPCELGAESEANVAVFVLPGTEWTADGAEDTTGNAGLDGSGAVPWGLGAPGSNVDGVSAFAPRRSKTLRRGRFASG